MNASLKQTLVAMATAALGITAASTGDAGPIATDVATGPDMPAAGAGTAEAACGEGDCGEGDCSDGDGGDGGRTSARTLA